MTEEEISELYTRLAFQYESSIDSLLARQIIDSDIATTSREKFYDSLNEEKLRTSSKIRDYREIIRLYMGLMTCKDMVSLTELVKPYSGESPGYVIQSWMRSRNTLEFLRQWENDINAEFDDMACEELIHQGHTTLLTITPSLWIRKTHAIGMCVKQGKGGGVSAYPEIAADFHLWLDPKARLAIVRACLISSDEDGNEGESKNLSRNNKFTLTIFPKPAEFVQSAEKALYHPTTRQHNKSV